MQVKDHIKNIKDCAVEFIDRVNSKNMKELSDDLMISQLLLANEIQGKNRQVVERVMSVSSKMFLDAIALYMIENKLEIKEVKEDDTI